MYKTELAKLALKRAKRQETSSHGREDSEGTIFFRRLYESLDRFGKDSVAVRIDGDVTEPVSRAWVKLPVAARWYEVGDSVIPVRKPPTTSAATVFVTIGEAVGLLQSEQNYLKSMVALASQPFIQV